MRLSAGVQRFRAVRADRASDEGGLTLIELLVVIAILSIIVVPLGDALINYLRHENDTTDRLSVSRDSQIAAAFFAQDVASMGRQDWDPNSSSFLLPLPSLYTGPSGAVPCTISGATPVVRLVSDLPTQAQGSAGVRSVAYVLVLGANGLLDLHRLLCDSGSSTPTSDLVVASDVDPGNPPTLTCPDTSCADGSVPHSVKLVLYLKAPSDSNDSLIVTLYGQRRQT